MYIYLALLAFLLVPRLAFAQSVADPLTVGSGVTLLVSVLLGACIQLQKSGKLLGQYNAPGSLIVAMGLAVPFLSGFVQTLTAYTFSDASLFYATVSGLTNVVGAAGTGIAIHAHFTVPEGTKRASAARAALAASVVAGFVMMGACTTAQLNADLSAIENAISKGQSLVVPAEDFACTVANAVDPSGGTAICQEVDSTGALVGEAFTVAETAPAIVALVAKTSPAMQAQVRASFAKRGAK